MKAKVVYHSTTGNTRKIAEAIASAAQCKAESVADVQLSENEKIDLLFIGDGVYFNAINKATKEFIQSLSVKQVKAVALFSTYGGNNKAVEIMKNMLEKQNILVLKQSFECKGQSWLVMNRHHPNESDLKQAQAFTAEVIKRNR